MLPTRAKKLGSEEATASHGWKFSPNTEEFVKYYYKGDYESEDGTPGKPHTLEQTHAGLASQMATWHTRNDRALGKLYRLFLWAAVAVAIGLVTWTIDLVFAFEGAGGSQ